MKHTRFTSLFNNYKTTTRVVLVVFLAILSLACYYIVTSYIHYQETTLTRLDAIAQTLSLQINGDKHEELTASCKDKGCIKTNDENSLYSTVQQQLEATQKGNNLQSDISTLYYNDTLKKFLYVVNSSHEPYYLDEYTQNKEKFLNIYQQGGTLPEYTDEYGTWLTALRPIKNKQGKVIALLEVDERYDDFLHIADKELYKNIAVMLVIFGIVAFALLHYVRNILLNEEKTKKDLQRSHKLINEHNKEILNSIYYAKKIQTAMLPPFALIHKNLPKSFVLYEPKDIVSGDFYFFKEIIPQQLFYIAACDCTGHGVPGAFMSMIGNNILEHVIHNTPNITPAQVLTQTNIEITNALKQEGATEQSRDGMDVALCLVNIATNTLTYAGANRPLYAVDAQSVLTEHKGDKRPIGGLDNEGYEFTQHTITLTQGTTYYMFTDGYADQFGGEKDKKFSTKKLKETLCAVNLKQPKEQHLYIAQANNNWKAHHEQTDDVLLIGFSM
ncbi:MAG: SpoIIE family protein phosphatase [Bacteroidia bacterium]